MDDAVAVVATKATGSQPPISRWPVSRHQPTSDAAQQPLDVGGALDSVPACGCSASVSPWAATSSSIAARLRTTAAGLRSSSAGGRRPGGVGDERAHEHLGAGGGQAARRVLRGGAGAVERGLVQDERHEAADEREPVRVEPLAQRAGVERQPAERAELRRRQAEPGHLGEHALGRELQAPARHLAHAPRDRRAGQPHARRRTVLVPRNRAVSLPTFPFLVWSAPRN